MANKNKKLIIFTEGITTSSEKCRDWDVNFEPQKGDYVKLQDYKLFESSKDLFNEKDATYSVVARTITEKVLYVHLWKVDRMGNPYFDEK